MSIKSKLNASASILGSSYFKDSLLTLALGVLGIAYTLVDQAFAARISVDHLYLISMLSYVTLAFVLISRLLGQSALVLLTGEDDRKGSIGGALTSYLVLGLILPVLMLAEPVISERLGIQHIDGAAPSLRLQAVVAFLVGFNLYIRFILIARSEVRLAIIADITGNILNLIGNTIAFFAFDEAGARFLGCLTSTLVVQITILLFFVQRFKRDASLGKLSPLPYIRRARAILSGESVYVVSGAAVPFLFTLLLSQSGEVILVNAYNVGIAVTMLLDRPFTANLLTATARLSSERKRSELRDLEQSLAYVQSVNRFWLGIALMALAFFPFILRHVYKIDQIQGQLVVLFLVISELPRCIFVPGLAWLKSLEKHRLIGRADLAFGAFANLALFVLLRDHLPVVTAMGISFGTTTLIWGLTIAALITRYKKAPNTMTVRR